RARTRAATTPARTSARRTARPTAARSRSGTRARRSRSDARSLMRSARGAHRGRHPAPQRPWARKPAPAPHRSPTPGAPPWRKVVVGGVMPDDIDRLARGEAPGRVLVVEDREPIRRALGDLLLDRGFEVRVAADGVKGVEAASLWNPD